MQSRAGSSVECRRLSCSFPMNRWQGVRSSNKQGRVWPASKHAAAHKQQQRCKGSQRRSARHAALLGRQHAAWSVLTSGARCRRSRPRAAARPTAPKSLPAPPPRPAWRQSTCKGNMAELWQRWAGTAGEPVAPLPATPVAGRHRLTAERVLAARRTGQTRVQIPPMCRPPTPAALLVLDCYKVSNI